MYCVLINTVKYSILLVRGGEVSLSWEQLMSASPADFQIQDKSTSAARAEAKVHRVAASGKWAAKMGGWMVRLSCNCGGVSSDICSACGMCAKETESRY